jgi:hypothetical protein
MTEKRSFDRYSLWFPVTIEGAARRVWAVCKDASAGGILISGTQGLCVGDIVNVSFRVSPESAERTLTGRIVRVEVPDENPRAVWSHRMAIEFIEPDATLQSSFSRASSRPPPAPA